MAAIFLAAALTALMACILLVLDIGNLYAAQRNLEQQATLAALAGAQSLCMTTVTPGTAVDDNILSNTQTNQITPMMGSGGLQTGYVDSSSGTQLFTPKTPPPNVPPAVQVNLTATSPPGLVSALAPRTRHTLSATAAASERLYGKYMVGTNAGSTGGVTIDGITIGDLPLDVPVNLSLSEPALSPLASVSAYITSMSPPTTTEFYSPTYAATSQHLLVQVRLSVNVNLAGFVGATMPLGIDIDLPASDANLTEISCPSGTDTTEYTAIVMADTSAATVKVGTFSGSATATSVPVLTPGPATLLTLSVAGIPAASVTQTSGPATLNVDASPMMPLEFTTFASGDPTDAACIDEIYGTGPNADVCYVGTAPGNTQTVTAPSGETLASTVNSALTQFLGSNLSVNPLILPALLPIPVVSLPTVLTSSLTGVGAGVDAILDPVLSLLGTNVGSTTVTFLAIEHGSPISNTFTTVASGS